jgi:hypothetical protein
MRARRAVASADDAGDSGVLRARLAGGSPIPPVERQLLRSARPVITARGGRT